MALLAVGLGLQLPLVLDVPVQLLGMLLVMATAVPRQCWPAHAAAGVAGPHQPSGGSTLFQLNHDKYSSFALVADWPFAQMHYAPAALALSDRGLCTAVVVWAQLVMAVGLPAVVLWAAEGRERRRFLRRAQAQAGGDGGGDGAQAPQPAAGAGDGDGFGDAAWLYFFFAAQVCWCVVRTVAAKLAPSEGMASF